MDMKSNTTTHIPYLIIRIKDRDRSIAVTYL